MGFGYGFRDPWTHISARAEYSLAGFDATHSCIAIDRFSGWSDMTVSLVLELGAATLNMGQSLRTSRRTQSTLWFLGSDQPRLCGQQTCAKSNHGHDLLFPLRLER